MEDEIFDKLKIVGIVVSVLLLLAIGGLLVYKKINKNDVKLIAVETTTNINKDNKEFNVESYSKSIRQSFDNTDSIFLYDNTVKRIDFYANKKCDKLGTKVNLNSNGYTVNYTCSKELSKNEWEIKGKIDGIDFTYKTNNQSVKTNYYRVNNYILKIENKTNFNTTNIIIYDSKTGNVLQTINDIITPYTYDEKDNKYNSNMYVKKGILFYQVAANIHKDEITDEDISSDCLIYKIDFNKSSKSEKLHNYVCSYIAG